MNVPAADGERHSASPPRSADLRVEAGPGVCSRDSASVDARADAAALVGLGGRDQRHHLRIEQLAQRALGEVAEGRIEREAGEPRKIASATETQVSSRREREYTRTRRGRQPGSRASAKR